MAADAVQNGSGGLAPAAAGSDAAPDGVRSYDFRNPERLTRAVRQQLEGHGRSLAGALADRWSGILGGGIGIELSAVRELSASAFAGEPYDPLFSLSPGTAGAQVWVRLEASLAGALVERMLGGVGTPAPCSRGPTDIELALLRPFVQAAQAALFEARGEGSAAPEPERVNDAARAEAGEGHGIACAMEVGLGEARARVHFFYDDRTMAEVFGLEAGSSGSGRPSGRKSDRITAEMVGGLPLTLEAEFEPTPVQIRDIAGLEVGDVIRLGQKLTDEVRVFIGGKAAFRAYPGAVEGARGVQITRPA
jgi:flagellar motor switch protein FliM